MDLKNASIYCICLYEFTSSFFLPPCTSPWSCLVAFCSPTHAHVQMQIKQIKCHKHSSWRVVMDMGSVDLNLKFLFIYVCVFLAINMSQDYFYVSFQFINNIMDYDEACFMHLTPGVVHNFPKAVGV